MNTIRTPFKLPLTAAATALLLAACGGGGGNDTAVSASPETPGTTTANLEVASTSSTGTPSAAAGTEAGNSGSATADPAKADRYPSLHTERGCGAHFRTRCAR